MKTIKELITLLFYQSDEDRHEEWEEEYKKKRASKFSKAFTQTMTEDIKLLTKELDKI